MKNRFETRGEETIIYLVHRSGVSQARIDTTDLPKVQAFPGTWAAHPGPQDRLYVQGKLRNPQTQEHRTVYLHRWIADADENTLVQPVGDPLDCRRAALRVSRKRHSYQWQLNRRETESERLQYTKALANRVAADSGFAAAPLLRGLQRRTLAELDPALEDTASRLSREHVSSLPPLRIRAGWEHRLEEIIGALEGAPGELIGRRDVERVFQVSRRTAVQILDRFGANLAANALVLPRAKLLERLRRVSQDPAVRFERERHARTVSEASRDSLGEVLGVAAQRLQNNRSYAEGDVAARHRATRFQDFPAEIDLTPSSLHIQFGGLQDFLLKIGAVVYALQNDLETIEGFLASRPT